MPIADLQACSKHERAMPQQPLRLAQYLFYKGRISSQQLVEAVVWQRNSRPLVGQLAAELGLLSAPEVERIVANCKPGEAFCDAAGRLGYITHQERRSVLEAQRRRQPLIGRYFVRRGLLAEQALTELVEQARGHNRRQRAAAG